MAARASGGRLTGVAGAGGAGCGRMPGGAPGAGPPPYAAPPAARAPPAAPGPVGGGGVNPLRACRTTYYIMHGWQKTNTETVQQKIIIFCVICPVARPGFIGSKALLFILLTKSLL